MSGASTESELRHLLDSSTDDSGPGTPFPGPEDPRELNAPVSLADALARLPPAPPRRQEARRQRPATLAVEPIHVFPASNSFRERAEGVGRRVRKRVMGITRAVRRWVGGRWHRE